METLKNISRPCGIAVIVLASSLSAPAFAQPATTQGASQATVVEPVQVTNTADLAFGSIVAPASGTARVTINARTGGRTTNVNAAVVGSAFSRGTFVVSGTPNSSVNLTVSSPTIVLNGPGPSMTVDELRVSRNAAGQRTLPQLYDIPASGSMDVGFGGRLRFPAGQTPGNYSGTFDLTVTYQ